MAQTVQAAPLPWGETNFIWFSTAAPSAASEGPYNKGDWVVITAPTASNPVVYVCVTAGNGATAVFKTLTLGA